MTYQLVFNTLTKRIQNACPHGRMPNAILIQAFCRMAMMAQSDSATCEAATNSNPYPSHLGN
jgi:hypothetical protein